MFSKKDVKISSVVLAFAKSQTSFPYFSNLSCSGCRFHKHPFVYLGKREGELPFVDLPTCPRTNAIKRPS